MRAIGLLALPAVMLATRSLNLDRVAVRGSMDPKEHQLVAHLGTATRTPFGMITVTGRADVRYECNGSFEGTISYGRMIRALASLKGVKLVSSVRGQRDSLSASECSALQTVCSGTSSCETRC